MPPTNNPVFCGDTEATQKLQRELSVTLQESHPHYFHDGNSLMQENLDRTAETLHDTQYLLANSKDLYRKFHPLQEQLQSFTIDTNKLITTITNLSQSIQTLLTDSADIALSQH